ncbi:MAG: choice-of-anchor L domain-containing protein [Myxococcales bacterium]|nr:choice-of-anchor L domain-containing protein [Myxococcales bacterium]MCB9566357.1 choice-of-anchor L domain-containing protein [Myxococcales bacterium]MCB9705783.1 choice-of-anchor L domain-containing protein [Myxococcales bacterium]
MRMFSYPRLAHLLILAPGLGACGGPEEEESVSVGSGIGSITVTVSASGTASASGGSDSDSEGSSGSGSGASDGDLPEFKYDVGAVPGGSGDPTGVDPCEDTGPDCVCTIPDHVPCDNGTSDPFLAMGLNCPGELQVQASTMGNGAGIGVRSNFGANGTFNPREGSVYAVIGSGLVADLNQVTPQNDSNAGPTHCNDSLGISLGANLPAPLKPNAVGGDCTQNPGLVGTGDCSGTIQGQFSQGGAAFDYTELRFVLQVPTDVTSFSYDFAFFSVEWPYYYGSQYNDMYVGWLESELWTGNISFDQNGNPISLNAGFLDFQDQGGNLPEFAGTCMRQHAGTNWLKSTVGVTPNEQITVVFAIFDLSDPILDSYAFIDNFQWGCEPSGKPQTIPS